MKDKKSDPFLISEIKEGGLGNDLVTEDFENGSIDIKSFANWFYIEQAGMNIINCLTEQFPSVEILEHYNDYYKLRIPRGDKTIGYVFGFIEGQKQPFKISEYSVSQTTLEQIFQSFANQKIDNEGQKKLIFKRLIGSARAELYSERNLDPPPKQRLPTKENSPSESLNSQNKLQSSSKKMLQ